MSAVRPREIFPDSSTYTADPAEQAITVGEVKAYSRIDIDDDDELIDALIEAARESIEETIGGLTLVNRTVADRLHVPPGAAARVTLARRPVSAITSISYIDGNGDAQTWAASLYQVDIYSAQARVRPVTGGSWPTTQTGTDNTVTITYTAGFGAAATAVPKAIRQAMLLMVGHLYAYREPIAFGSFEALPYSVQALLGAYKTGRVF